MINYNVFVKHLLKASVLVLCSSNTFAIGDSIATTPNVLPFLIGIIIFILLCVGVVTFICFKMVGSKNRGKWALFGGIPSIICAIIFSWKLAICIAFAVAFWLRLQAIKNENINENINKNINKNNDEVN